jgi:tyrosinase
MYLYFFERIIEKHVGEPFAVPYWTYSANEHGTRTLPPEFLNQTEGGARNPLFYPARNPEFLLGGTGFRTAAEVSAAQAFDEPTLLENRRSDGFSFFLNVRPHGNVHGAVGTVEGMGAFEKAARDPIFWLHHANIDRLWESWRRPSSSGNSPRDSVANSQSEADWNRHAKFAFVGIGGERVEMSVADVLRASDRFGVRYDRLESVPVMMGIAGEPDETAPPATTLAQPSSPSAPQITTKDAAVSVAMSPAVEPPVALGFGDRPSTRYTLVVDVEAASAPGAVYDVYLKVRGSGAGEQIEHLVGTFNLFSGRHRNDQHSLQAQWKADITPLVRSQLLDPRVPGDLTFRARYANPAVPVTIKSVRIEAK